jgi:hypothetical protein
VVGRVAKFEVTFLYQWRVGIGRSEEGDRRRWCEFNTSISTREERQRDKALSEDKAEAASSSWLYEKEA